MSIRFSFYNKIRTGEKGRSIIDNCKITYKEKKIYIHLYTFSHRSKNFLLHF